MINDVVGLVHVVIAVIHAQITIEMYYIAFTPAKPAIQINSVRFVRVSRHAYKQSNSDVDGS